MDSAEGLLVLSILCWSQEHQWCLGVMENILTAMSPDSLGCPEKSWEEVGQCPFDMALVPHHLLSSL